jgi:uncharacterized protein (TIGR00255 family)
MIKSMTAFASVDKSADNLSIAVEVRAYNSRYLDILLRIAPGYQQLEEKIKARVVQKLKRGRIDVKIQLKDAADAGGAYEIDAEKARSYYTVLQEMKALLNLKGDVSLDLLAARGELVKPKEKVVDLNATWDLLAGCLEEVLDSLDAMRQREGAAIENDFLLRLRGIQDAIDRIESLSEDVLEHYSKRLRERIGTLAGDALELDSGRIEQEAALLAERSDIAEEILRVNSHLKQFQEIMKTESPAGQKLNFLLQEINREFNTIGSKAGNAEISHLVVDVKSELEKLREQVQNVE